MLEGVKYTLLVETEMDSAVVEKILRCVTAVLVGEIMGVVMTKEGVIVIKGGFVVTKIGVAMTDVEVIASKPIVATTDDVGVVICEVGVLSTEVSLIKSKESVATIEVGVIKFDEEENVVI